MIVAILLSLSVALAQDDEAPEAPPAETAPPVEGPAPPAEAPPPVEAARPPAEAPPVEAARPPVERPPAPAHPPEAAPNVERPLAIPQTPRVSRPPPAPAAPADPELGADRLQALRKYRRQHLSVQHYSGLAVGSTLQTDYYGYGGYGGWGWRSMHVPYYYRVDGWGVFQGPQRLDTLSYLDRVGELSLQQVVKQKVRAKRTMGGVLYGLGVAGIAGSIVAGAGATDARTRAELSQWRLLSTASVGAILGGFIGGSFPLSKARRLLAHPGNTVDLAVIEEQVADFNEDLRLKLALTPRDVLSLENTDAR